MGWRWIAAIACLLAFSACRSQPTSAERYRDAVKALRNGNAPQAIALAQVAAKQCRPGTECVWSARLLEAEVLILNGQLAAAGTILSENLPQGAEFAALAAR